jgi:hypothetical protein
MGLGELTARTPEQLARELKLYKYHEGKLVLDPVLDQNGVHLTDEKGEPRWRPALATGEAFDAQLKARLGILPYLAQKLPLAIEAKSERRGLFLVGDLNALVQQAAEDGLPLADAPIDVTPEPGT